MTAAVIDELASVRRRCGGHWGRRKQARLRAARRLNLVDNRLIRNYHEQLLFLSAFPDDATIRRLAHSELDRVAAAIAAKPASRLSAGRLQNSGIAGTILSCAFGIDTVRWLSHRFPNDIELIWDDDAFAAGLDDFFQDFIANVEQDGIRSDRVDPGEWVGLATTGNGSCAVANLIEMLDGLGLPNGALNQLYNSLHLEIRWRLDSPDASRSFIRFPARPLAYRRSAGRGANRLKTELGRTLPVTRPLPKRAGQEVIDAARAALAVRQRETDGITYADPNDVVLFHLERGVDVAVFGSVPERRSPVEVFCAYMIVKNRVPVGYGGGWIFGRRLEIGGNVFEEFRGAESDHLMAQVLRVYHQYFGTEQFFIDPVQFGYDNEEAIASGAFWFYYRLGFRPTEAALLELAMREWSRIKADRCYRTSPRVLRRLAEAKLCWLPENAAEPDEGPSLSDIGLAVTRHIATEFGGDRQRAFRWASARLRRILNVGDRTTWPVSEQNSYRNQSLLVAMIDNLSSWSAHDRRRLVSLMRAKGGRHEVDYARRLRNHPRMIPALARIATRAASEPADSVR